MILPGKRIIRNILLGVFLFLVLGLVGLELLARSYREKAGSYFRTQFSSQSELVLQPFVTSVSIWKNFPRVTFSFDNIALVDTTSATPLQVIAVKRAEISIPLTQFNLKRIRISRVNLQDLVFHQRVDSSGNKYGLRFQQEVKADTVGSKVSFVIQKLVITRGQYLSENYYKKSAVSLALNESDLRVERIGKNLKITGNLQGHINYISNNRLRLYKNQPYKLTGNYLLKAATNTGYISNTHLFLHGNTLNISGNHTRLPSGQGARLDITMSGYQPLLYLFRQLIPPRTLPVLDKVKTNSRVYLVCKLQGNSGPKLRPRSIIQFKLTNGEVLVTGSKSVIKGIQLVGSLDNGRQQGLQTSNLTISNASARIGRGFLQMNFSLTNFLKPAFAFKAKGQMDLPEMARLFPLPVAQVYQGILSGNINLQANFADSLNNTNQKFKGQGIIRLQNASFRPEGLTVPCQQVNGEFRISENDLILKNLSGNIGSQPFRIMASIQNYVPYLFGQPGNIKAKASIYAKQFKSSWLEGNVFAATTRISHPQSGNILPTSYILPPPITGRPSFKQTSLLQENSNKPSRKTKGRLGSRRTNQLIQSLLAATSSQLNVKLDVLTLTSAEAIRNLAFQVNQNGSDVSLTQMRFNTFENGNATANGGFRLTRAGVQNPRLSVFLQYDFLDLRKFMQHIANLKEMTPNNGVSPAPIRRAKLKKFQENDYWVQLQVKARGVQYEYLKGTNLTLEANLNNYRARLTQLNLNALQGHISSKGVIYLDEPTDTYPVRLQSRVENVDLQQVFTVANQMNLDVLSNQNIKGKVSCNLAVLTYLDQTFAPTMDKTVAYAKANFKDMELIEVSPIQNALRFLRKERTNHLYFEDVTTSFVLQNNQFMTPLLRLNSNLTDFELSGKYVMGGGAHLNMDINVLNVLFGNNKKRIERIQADSSAAKNEQNKQHLELIREENKFKVKLSNKKDRAENALALKEEFNSILQHHQIDTVFTPSKNLLLAPNNKN